MGLTPEELAEFVEASCRRQGVPVKVEDAGVVGRVAALLLGGEAGTGDSPAPTHRGAQSFQTGSARVGSNWLARGDPAAITT